jgi:hypothetical protein
LEFRLQAVHFKNPPQGGTPTDSPGASCCIHDPEKLLSMIPVACRSQSSKTSIPLAIRFVGARHHVPIRHSIVGNFCTFRLPPQIVF